MNSSLSLQCSVKYQTAHMQAKWYKDISKMYFHILWTAGVLPNCVNMFILLLNALCMRHWSMIYQYNHERVINKYYLIQMTLTTYITWIFPCIVTGHVDVYMRDEQLFSVLTRLFIYLGIPSDTPAKITKVSLNLWTHLI